MNYPLISLEIAVVLLGLALLVLDLWASDQVRRRLGDVAALALGCILLFSFTSAIDTGERAYAFHWMFVQDPLALFFKRLFLTAAILVLLFSVEFSDRLATGVGEYTALTLFALAGMMFAASANDFALLFVAVELITITFYVLASYPRGRLLALEAGVKYLILGALASAFLVFGIALIFGTTGRLNFDELASVTPELVTNPLFQAGLLLVLGGLAFKIAIVPMQIWTPDVYQGAATPTTAFLAIGSKAAGFVLLLRVLFVAVPDAAQHWSRLWIVLSGASILYGNLCAIPQRNLKRLLGYSSIAHAGYLLLGVAALTTEGQSAVLFYLGGYLFSVLAAFGVVIVVLRHLENEDVSALAGLHQRSPFLAATLALALVSLAGIPPLVGFFGKFLLITAVLTQGAADPAYYWLAGVALAGVVISIYYYFRVVRAIYWSEDAPNPTAPLPISRPMSWALAACLLGMLGFGLAPHSLLELSRLAVTALQF